MRQRIAQLIADHTAGVLTFSQVDSLLEIPPDDLLGDYAFPCFVLAKSLRKAPATIASELAKQLDDLPDYITRVEAKGPYLNVFVAVAPLAHTLLTNIEQPDWGSTQSRAGQTIPLDFSSPNISKPFGIGHLRSTIIGNAIANILTFQGANVIRINYLGDWGTPHGKIIAGYLEFGDEQAFQQNPIIHLYDIYKKVSADERFEELGREWFKKLEEKDEQALHYWNLFRQASIKEFDRVYTLLGVTFDLIDGESQQEEHIKNAIDQLEQHNLLVESQGAKVVDLEQYDLGVCLIQKSDGASLYAARDIAAAIHRISSHGAKMLVYEVGNEQQLHFKQVFKVLELLGYDLPLYHISHGLYLGADGKKFATRAGKLVFLDDVIAHTKQLAAQAISARHNLDEQELQHRSLIIARAAILYGDLKNYREQDMIFDIEKFSSFDGDTGPYLLYSYARASSLLSKSVLSQPAVPDTITLAESRLIKRLLLLPDIIQKADNKYDPSVIANYAYGLSQLFTELYHTQKIIGSESESFQLALVNAYRITLQRCLSLLGIDVLEQM